MSVLNVHPLDVHVRKEASGNSGKKYCADKESFRSDASLSFGKSKTPAQACLNMNPSLWGQSLIGKDYIRVMDFNGNTRDFVDTSIF